MRLIKDVRIVVKTILPLVILAALVIGFVFVSSSYMTKIIKSSDEVISNYTMGISQLGDIATDYKTLERIAYAHCIADNKRTKQSLEAEADKVSGEIDSACKEFEKTLDEGDESNAYSEFQLQYTAFHTTFDKIIELSGKGETEEAIKQINGKLALQGVDLGRLIQKMRDANSEGMLDASKKTEKIYNVARNTNVGMLVCAIFAIFVSMFVCFVEVVTPISNSSKKLRGIVDDIKAGEGDLTKRIDVKGKDELGRMATDINEFIETLQSIMLHITSHSQSLDKIVGQVTESVSLANGNACDISAVMEQLSASMQEVSATSSNINANTTYVEGNVKELSQASENLAAYASEMRERATQLERDAISNKDEANAIVSQILAALEQAVEDSKSVNKVNELTDEILSISSQTNLLALNASIEAARAGEAGKGFAVVADEIRQLADSSRETASNIQNINSMVIAAVKDLVKNTDEIVEYVKESVLPAYENFVMGGTQYKDDADHVNEIVEQFSEMSININKLIGDITDSMNGITAAVEESANAVTTAASNTNELVKEIEQIGVEMDSNKEVADQLKIESDRFVQL